MRVVIPTLFALCVFTTWALGDAGSAPLGRVPYEPDPAVIYYGAADSLVHVRTRGVPIPLEELPEGYWAAVSIDEWPPGTVYGMWWVTFLDYDGPPQCGGEAYWALDIFPKRPLMVGRLRGGQAVLIVAGADRGASPLHRQQPGNYILPYRLGLSERDGLSAVCIPLGVVAVAPVATTPSYYQLTITED